MTAPTVREAAEKLRATNVMDVDEHALDALADLMEEVDAYMKWTQGEGDDSIEPYISLGKALADAVREVGR